MNLELAKKISQAAAICLNDGRPEAAAATLDAIFSKNATPAEKLAAIATTPIYSLVAEQPGYPDDGRPGYLAFGSNLKQAVLEEIAAMIEADFDKEEHKNTWRQIQKNVEATPEADFLPGVAVNCPDDYLLTLDKCFVSEVLREYKALPSWS